LLVNLEPAADVIRIVLQIDGKKQMNFTSKIKLTELLLKNNI